MYKPILRSDTYCPTAPAQARSQVLQRRFLPQNIAKITDKLMDEEKY
jgi:hypothetical protein